MIKTVSLNMKNNGVWEEFGKVELMVSDDIIITQTPTLLVYTKFYSLLLNEVCENIPNSFTEFLKLIGFDELFALGELSFKVNSSRINVGVSVN